MLLWVIGLNPSTNPTVSDALGKIQENVNITGNVASSALSNVQNSLNIKIDTVQNNLDSKIDTSIQTYGPWKLIDIIDSTVGYSGTWKAPDVFLDGSAYDLGAYIIGGGGSGSTLVSSGSAGQRASGGGSGYGKNVIFKNIVPMSSYNWVIGKGGNAVAVNSSKYMPGNNGNSTTFNKITAQGGNGGDIGNSYQLNGASGGTGSDTISYTTIPREYAPCCCDMPVLYAWSASSMSSPKVNPWSQSPRYGQNMFDQTMKTLSAGGCSTYFKSTEDVVTANKQNKVSFLSYNYGNGGDAGYYSSDFNPSEKGEDGAIFLYARRSTI